MTKVSYDEQNGVVVNVADDFLTPEGIKEMFRQTVPLSERSRARHGRMLMLLDLRRAPVQSTETIELIQTERDRARLPGDCCAVVVASMLTKIQAALLTVPGYHQAYFQTPGAAIAWLLEQAATPVDTRKPATAAATRR